MLVRTNLRAFMVLELLGVGGERGRSTGVIGGGGGGKGRKGS